MTKTARRACAMLAIATLILAGVGMLIALLSKPQTTSWQEVRDAVSEVRPGMTLDEVQATLGLPPGNHSDQEPGRALKFLPELYPYLGNQLTGRAWIFNEGVIIAQFDKDDRLLGTTTILAHPQPTFMDRLRSWFR